MRNPVGWVRLAALAAGLSLAACARSEPEPANSTEATLIDFTRRVEAYVTLRNRLADSLGPVSENVSQADIAARAARLAASIQQARSGAEQGQLFTPEVSAVLATLIRQEYSRRPPPILETREDQQDELPAVFAPVVNQLYPTTYPLATFPPALLPLLPALPEQVEYRIVGRDLILRDVEANLIVDVLPDAMPQ
jgi:hypothetical protein